jgi:hypothetical protein
MAAIPSPNGRTFGCSRYMYDIAYRIVLTRLKPVGNVGSEALPSAVVIEEHRVGVKVGTRLKSVTSATEVIIVKGSDRDAELECAGAVMTTEGGDGTGQITDGPQLLLGKRYSDEESGIEALCTKPGIGPLTYEGRELGQNVAKQLPASD